MQTELDVFVSSSMKEFPAERAMLGDLIPTLSQGVITLRAWVYEESSYASDETIKELYSRHLHGAELYIGIFGRLYGKYTIDEFNTATDWGVTRLIFVRNLGAGETRERELEDFLRKIGDVELGQLAPFYFNDLDHLKMAVIHSIQHWLANRIAHRSGSSSAVLANHPDMLEDRPRKLIGREALIAQINPLLDQGETVLLQGFGGMGKTALAATVAANRINGRPVLWQKLGSESADVVFEAIARPFNAQQAVASARDDEKRQVVRQLLVGANVGLVVLDDAWDGKALNTVLKAVPNSIPVLVTSRHRYGIGKVIQVGELSPDKALEMLGNYAGMDFTGDANAATLCRLVGYHAFALEVAGRTMRSADLTPNELMRQIVERPFDMAVPEDFAEEGRRTVADLLNASLTLLDNETQRVFIAMGAFFAKQMTAEMLALYFMDKPEVSDQMLVEVRREFPDLASLSDDEVRQMILRELVPPGLEVDTSQVEQALDKLVMRGLAERERGNEQTVTYYRLHDLSYSYARAKNTDENRYRALNACLVYVEQYKEPNLANFAALRPEMDNFMNAASWAMEMGAYNEVEQFAWRLYFDRQGRFLFRQGYHAQSLNMLKQAVVAAQYQGKRREEGAYLLMLGLAYINLGQVAESIKCNEQALVVAREVRNRQDEGVALGNLGNAYLDLGRNEQAISYHEQALAIYREIGDRWREGAELGSLGNIYRNLEQLPEAIEYYQQSLSIAREIGNRHGEGTNLGNLGNAYRGLGQDQQAINYYEQSLAIDREIGDRQGEGINLCNLGNAYRDLEQYDKALLCYQRGLVIAQETGDRANQAYILWGMGIYHQDIGNPQTALEFLQQSRAIFVEIGATHKVEVVDEGIARLSGR